MGARYYDPGLGRFITRDTWEGHAYQPWTRNLYTYGRGNPVIYIDPTGHAGILPDGTFYDCTPVDIELLLLKMEYERATSDSERERIANEAALLRAANPGRYLVQADKSLRDYHIPYQESSWEEFLGVVHAFAGAVGTAAGIAVVVVVIIGSGGLALPAALPVLTGVGAGATYASIGVAVAQGVCGYRDWEDVVPKVVLSVASVRIGASGVGKSIRHCAQCTLCSGHAGVQ